jgi:hypothetical protein
MKWLGDRRVLAGFMLAWAVFTVGAFWELEGQYLRPVPRPAGAAIPHPGIVSPIAWLSTDRGLVRLARPNGVILLNFWSPTCPCSRFMEGHVRDIGAQYGPRGVDLVTVVECGKQAADQEQAMAAWRSRGLTEFAAAADANGWIARKFGVWAPPAAVIIDRKGRVQYVGAYNVARYCDDTHSAYAAMALAAVVAGRRPPRSTLPFYGCQIVPTGN